MRLKCAIYICASEKVGVGADVRRGLGIVWNIGDVILVTKGYLVLANVKKLILYGWASMAKLLVVALLLRIDDGLNSESHGSFG